MRKFIFSLIILTLLIGGILFFSAKTKSIYSTMLNFTQEAVASIQINNTNIAKAQVSRAQRLLTEHSDYLYLVCRRSSITNLNDLFNRAMHYADCENYDEFLICCSSINGILQDLKNEQINIIKLYCEMD